MPAHRSGNSLKTSQVCFGPERSALLCFLMSRGLVRRRKALNVVFFELLISMVFMASLPDKSIA